jgi:hypothetical protein
LLLKMNDFCPLIKKECKEHKCRFFIQIQGKNPNTGEPINRYDCAISWLPILMIENSAQSRQTGAAVESFRNEMVKISQSPLSLEH